MLTDIGEAFGIQIRMPGSARTEHDLQSGVLAKSWIMLHAAWDMHEHGPAASRSVIAKCHEWTRFRATCRELAFAPNTKEPPTPRSFEAALASNRASWSSRLINEVLDRTKGGRDVIHLEYLRGERPIGTSQGWRRAEIDGRRASNSSGCRIQPPLLRKYLDGVEVTPTSFYTRGSGREDGRGGRRG